jgi:hypothetical protein
VGQKNAENANEGRNGKNSKKNLLSYDCEKKRNTLFSKSFGRKILSNFTLP